MRSVKNLIALTPLLMLGCAGNGNNPVAVPTKSATVVTGGETSGALDGPLATATFNNPVNVAVEADGTVYVADFDNNRVRRIRSGVVSTLVSQAGFERPFGITLGFDGTLYVQTDANDTGARNSTTGTVWRVNKTTGVATVVARDLGRPRGILGLPNGLIAMANLTRNIIQTLDPATGTVAFIAGQDGVGTFADGTGVAAGFNRPYGLTRISDGSLLVADQSNNRIRRVTLAGVVTTFAGTGVVGATDGPVGTATFNGPQDVDLAPDGSVYVSDTTGKKIRRIRGSNVTTFAGDGLSGFIDGFGTSARFFGLEGSAVSPDGRYLFVADGTGGDDQPFHRVRVLRL